MKHQKIQIETDDFEGETLSGEITASDEDLLVEGDGTLVILLHDFPYSHSRDHNNLYGDLRGIFYDHGFQSLIFDFQSCGESEGYEQEFSLETARENIQRVLKWAQRRGFRKFVFVASGASAALALEFADKDTRMVFLFWPAVDLASYAKRIFYDSDGKVAAKGRKIGGDLLTQMEAYDPATALKSLPVPVLIQYGAQDDVIGPEQIDLIKKGFNALRIDITSYADGGYGLTNPRHRDMIAHHIGQFLQKYA